MEEIDGKNLNPNNGFPYCPHCGGPLAWECDNSAEEVGYTSGDERKDYMTIITTLVCHDCEKSFEVENDGLEYHHLCTFDNIDEDESEDEDDDVPHIEYTEYAIKNYPEMF